MGDLRAAYDAVRGADGQVENLYLAMSATPAAMRAADDHYRAVLHNPDNPLPAWLSELAATWVAILCGCDYAARNHGHNFARHLADADRADRWLAALRDGTWAATLSGPALAVVGFAEKLTLHPDAMARADLDALRAAGLSDRAVSYLVQIVAGFAYWARVINALGIRLNDRIGLSDADLHHLAAPRPAPGA